MYLSNNKILTKIGSWISTNLLIIECVLVVAIFSGLYARITNQTFSEILLNLSFISLGLAYYFKAFNPIDDENASVWEVYFYRISSFANALAIIGILFKLQQWVSHNLLIVAAVTFLIVIIPFIIFYRNNRDDCEIFNVRSIFRSIIILASAFFLLFADEVPIIYDVIKHY